MHALHWILIENLYTWLNDPDDFSIVYDIIIYNLREYVNLDVSRQKPTKFYQMNLASLVQ